MAENSQRTAAPLSIEGAGRGRFPEARQLGFALFVSSASKWRHTTRNTPPSSWREEPPITASTGGPQETGAKKRHLALLTTVGVMLPAKGALFLGSSDEDFRNT